MQTQGHPNATAALVTTGLAYILQRIDMHYHWVALSSQSWLLAAGALIGAVLFIGRKGILPTLSAILHGSVKATVGPASPPAPPPPAPPVA
jgi:hypothetical protein